MTIERIEVGNLATNCYILKQNGVCLIIDPGDEVEKIVSKMENNLLLAILITHHHEDHIGALDELSKHNSVPIIDAYCTNLNHQIGPFIFAIIETKGHTSDSITFYFPKEKVMFVGDFLFYHSIGRTDLPTGDIVAMEKSIEKLKMYNQDIICYPGHGRSTTIQEEIENNPFFRKIELSS